MKVVKVVGDGEETIVKYDGDTLEIKEANSRQISKIKVDESLNAVNPVAKASSVTASKTSLFWNYSYYYSDNRVNTSGMYFILSSGDKYGSWKGFDNRKTSVRDAALAFCAEVRTLDTNLWKASAATGVSALFSGGVAIAEWVASYNSSLDCNEKFMLLKQVI